MILDEIIAHKKQEIAERRELVPVKRLEQSTYFTAPCVSLAHYLQRPDKVGIIAEIKRKSPSKGDINPYISIEKLSIGYMQAGASALSVLTDAEFFGGSNEDLTTARKFNYCPILRKDFVVDEYQIVEARSIGADAILLIAAVLNQTQIREFATLANSFGMETVLEIHDANEIPADFAYISVVGVNNRDLKDFTVDVKRSFELAAKLPADLTKISESGLHDAATIDALKNVGFSGFLIGEAFMRTSQPQLACAELIKEIKQKSETPV